MARQYLAQKTLLGRGEEFFEMFLGRGTSPTYKRIFLAALFINPFLPGLIGTTATGWVVLAEFIAILATTFYCHPFHAGGFLLIEIFLMGLITVESAEQAMIDHQDITYMVMFMVAAVAGFKEVITLVFTKLILAVRSISLLSFLFLFVAGFMSAFFDAMTVVATIFIMFVGLHAIYHKFLSESITEHTPAFEARMHKNRRSDISRFDEFLCGIAMMMLVGTTVGGVMTKVGEPQNIIIAESEYLKWDFIEFFLRMAPLTIPVALTAFVVTFLVSRRQLFGYGIGLPRNVRYLLRKNDREEGKNRTRAELNMLIVQGVLAAVLIGMLLLHVAAVWMIGLIMLILGTSLTGRIGEHNLGKVLEEGAAFAAVLAVLFGMVALIHELHLFKPIIHWVLQLEGTERYVAFYLSTGILSAVSDNVFVASLYLGEAESLLAAGQISQVEFERICVMINTGTNIPSIATPNGQMAFLFAFMHPLAKLIGLSYFKMMKMAFPFLISMTLMSIISIEFLFLPITAYLF